jgi:hypothetical protein
VLRLLPLLLICAFALTLPEPGVAAGKNAPIGGVVPPQPMDMNLKVHREGKTEIPLRIYGVANEPLKYAIRRVPEHGKLSDPRQTEREVAVVIYEPPADLSITTDKFTYTVQSGAGVSAPVQITLTIVDQPPQLVIPDTLDFGTIRTGATNTRLLEISNKGGLFVTGEVIPDAPWKIEGKTGYHLGAGEVAVFKLTFHPEEGRSYEGVVRYTTDPQHSTTLRGVAEAAILIDPPQWVLQQAPGDPARTGTFELTSQLDEPRTVRLTTDRRLKIPAQIALAPRGKARVTVEAEPADVQSWDTEIRLESTDFSMAVPVHVPALEAILRSTTPAVAFGRLPVGKNGVAHFELENIGGAPGTVSWEISAPFVRPESSATLMPGEKKSFPLEIETKAPGHYRTWLEFTSGAQKFELAVQAEVVARAAPPASIPGVPAPAVDSSAPESAPEEGKPAVPLPLDMPPAIPFDWQADLHLPKGVTVHGITPTSAIIEWPASLSTMAHFRVEMKQYRVGSEGKLQAIWLRPTGIPIEDHGGTYAAMLTDLKPGQPWTVRVIPLEPSGAEAGARLFAVDFLTPEKPSLAARLPRITFLRVLLVVGAGLLARYGWKRWKKRPAF